MEKVEKRKTRMEKALDNSWREETSFKNINEAIKLAKNISITDTIDPNTKIRYDLAEIVSRLQNADELEIVDMDEYTGNFYPCS
tara:strand:- start:2567 stop:2818 length:252 start_codon:yes stop_codon:yes gene_type:complete